MTYLERQLVIMDICEALANVSDLDDATARAAAYMVASIDPRHIEMLDVDVASIEAVRRRLFGVAA